MRTGVTLEDVTRAADQLLASGERPTVEAVRGLLGTGAPATVNRLLQDYYRALAGRLTLPPAIAQASASLYSTIKQAAQAEVDAHEVQLHAELRRDRDQLAADRQAFEQERHSLRDRSVAQAAELQQLQEQRTSLERRLAEHEQLLVEQRRRAATAEAQAEAANAERQRAEEKHQAELQAQRSRADGNEKHFLQQIEELRTQLKRAQTERDKEVSSSRQRLSEFEDRLAQFAAEGNQLRMALSQAQEQLGRERERCQALENASKELDGRHSNDLARVRTQNEGLITDLQRERDRAEELRAERDRALQESALHQGRAQAFQLQLEQLSNPKPKTAAGNAEEEKALGPRKRNKSA